MVDHFRNDVFKRSLGLPSEGFSSFAGVAAGTLDIAWTIEGFIDSHKRFAGRCVSGEFFQTGARPAQFDAYLLERDIDEVLDGMERSGGENEVVGAGAVHHINDALHAVLRVAPVPLYMYVSQRERFEFA